MKKKYGQKSSNKGAFFDVPVKQEEPQSKLQTPPQAQSPQQQKSHQEPDLKILKIMNM